MQSSFNSPRPPPHTVRHLNGGRVLRDNLPHDNLPHDTNTPREGTGTENYFSNLKHIKISGVSMLSVGGNYYGPGGAALQGPGMNFITDHRTSTTAAFRPRKDSSGGEQGHDLVAVFKGDASGPDNASTPPAAQPQTPQQPSSWNSNYSHSVDVLQVASPYESDLEEGKLYIHNAFDLIKRIGADPDYTVDLNGFVCIWKRKQKVEVPVDSEC